MVSEDRHQPFQRLTLDNMSVHSYSRCWTHLIWGTLNREKLLNKQAAARVSPYLAEYADTKGVYMKINYVNADHVHALVDLPTNLSRTIFCGKNSRWGRGYGAFSISESNVKRVAEYIAAQEEHHRVRAFSDELREFVQRHGLRWQNEKAVKTA